MEELSNLTDLSLLVFLVEILKFEVEVIQALLVIFYAYEEGALKDQFALYLLWLLSAFNYLHFSLWK